MCAPASQRNAAAAPPLPGRRRPRALPRPHALEPLCRVTGPPCPQALASSTPAPRASPPSAPSTRRRSSPTACPRDRWAGARVCQRGGDWHRVLLRLAGAVHVRAGAAGAASAVALLLSCRGWLRRIATPQPTCPSRACTAMTPYRTASPPCRCCCSTTLEARRTARWRR